MKHNRFLWVAILLLSSASFAGQHRYILESKNLSALKKAVHENGGTEIRQMTHFKKLVVELPEQALERMQKRFPDLQIDEDTVLHASGKPGSPVQPAQKTPWGLTAISAPDVFSLNRGLGVKVCVVDTGISRQHPDLIQNIVGGRNFVVSRGVLDPNAYEDDNGHGSHVAGIVAAADNAIGTVGVAPLSSLYAVKVLDKRGSGYLSAIADGIMQCLSVGAQVINMSLGGQADPSLSSPLKAAVETALSQGVSVVVAAGNEGQNMNNTVPAGYSGTTAVAAVDINLQIASWSNFGLQGDDFTAPGVSIFSTWMGSSYNTISGTSMASPHVAGVVALKISSGSLGLQANDLGYSTSSQGQGLIDALATVLNH